MRAVKPPHYELDPVDDVHARTGRHGVTLTLGGHTFDLTHDQGDIILRALCPPILVHADHDTRCKVVEALVASVMDDEISASTAAMWLDMLGLSGDHDSLVNAADSMQTRDAILVDPDAWGTTQESDRLRDCWDEHLRRDVQALATIRQPSHPGAAA